jgi:integrase
MRKAAAAVNLRLPARLQSANIRGHSGRHTFTSGSVNSGVNDATTAAATKHRSMDSLKRYHHPSAETAVTPALSIARKQAHEARQVQDDEEEEEEVEEVAKKKLKSGGGFYVDSGVFSDSSSDED